MATAKPTKGAPAKPAGASSGAPEGKPEGKPATTGPSVASRVGAKLADQTGAPDAYRKVAETAANPLPLANAGGGLVLGAFTYVLALTYLRSGSAGVKAWLRAKFLNQVSTPAATSKGKGA